MCSTQTGASRRTVQCAHEEGGGRWCFLALLIACLACPAGFLVHQMLDKITVRICAWRGSTKTPEFILQPWTAGPAALYWCRKLSVFYGLHYSKYNSPIQHRERMADGQNEEGRIGEWEGPLHAVRCACGIATLAFKGALYWGSLPRNWGLNISINGRWVNSASSLIHKTNGDATVCANARRELSGRPLIRTLTSRLGNVQLWSSDFRQPDDKSIPGYMVSGISFTIDKYLKRWINV